MLSIQERSSLRETSHYYRCCGYKLSVLQFLHLALLTHPAVKLGYGLITRQQLPSTHIIQGSYKIYRWGNWDELKNNISQQGLCRQSLIWSTEESFLTKWCRQSFRPTGTAENDPVADLAWQWRVNHMTFGRGSPSRLSSLIKFLNERGKRVNFISPA